MGANDSNIRWYRSQPTAGGYSPDKIDAENGIIRDVVMVEEGPAKGHGVNLDAQFIRDIVAYDIKTFGDRGIKARFGHPSASNETMGTQMGVFKNQRVRDNSGKLQAIADLHLLEASELSPSHPGMRSWMLKMAAERPDFVVSSIVFRATSYFQKNEDGTKVHIRNRYDADSEKGEVFVEFGDKGEHYYTDLVEQGAATDNLFSNQVNPHLFVAQADEFLESHPNLKEFIKAHPEKVVAFFDSVGINISQLTPKKMSKVNLFEWLTGKKSEIDSETAEELRASLNEAQNQMKEFSAAKEAAENRVKELESDLGKLQSDLTASNDKVTALEADLTSANEKIAELEKEPGDEHSGGGDGEGGERAYHKNPIYQKFKSRAKAQA